ncbi:MAG: WbuC family cupin fold metalloprotein [Gammaproteobacteria bacterium]|nr:WbuC family cupin fold metalloprotein [Gammaproteobacteria bacterium]
MKLINQSMIGNLTAQAQQSPRARTNLNLHTQYDDPVQRLLIAIEPGSYVRPHRHLDANKWELFLIVRGRIAAVFFDDEGRMQDRILLSPQGPDHGFEIVPGQWHTVVALEPGTVFFEVKAGPFMPTSDKDFAIWAPAEGNARCADFLEWFVHGQPGSRYPG